MNTIIFRRIIIESYLHNIKLSFFILICIIYLCIKDIFVWKNIKKIFVVCFNVKNLNNDIIKMT